MRYGKNILPRKIQVEEKNPTKQISLNNEHTLH